MAILLGKTVLYDHHTMMLRQPRRVPAYSPIYIYIYVGGGNKKEREGGNGYASLKRNFMREKQGCCGSGGGRLNGSGSDP